MAMIIRSVEVVSLLPCHLIEEINHSLPMAAQAELYRIFQFYKFDHHVLERPLLFTTFLFKFRIMHIRPETYIHNRRSE